LFSNSENVSRTGKSKRVKDGDVQPKKLAKRLGLVGVLSTGDLICFMMLNVSIDAPHSWVVIIVFGMVSSCLSSTLVQTVTSEYTLIKILKKIAESQCSWFQRLIYSKRRPKLTVSGSFGKDEMMMSSTPSAPLLHSNE
jgi:hypothetical protein